MKYVTLKAAIAAAESRHGLHDIDPTTREMLLAIASANLAHTKIRVTDIKNKEIYGTLPTINARLKKLVEAGWIERKMDPKDARLVLLNITSKAKLIFDKISKTL